MAKNGPVHSIAIGIGFRNEDRRGNLLVSSSILGQVYWVSNRYVFLSLVFGPVVIFITSLRPVSGDARLVGVRVEHF